MPADAPMPAAPDGNVCPQCGNAVAFGAAFCNICGSKMPEIQRQPLGGALTPDNGSFTTPGFDTTMNAAPAAPVIPDVPVASTTQPMQIPVPDNAEFNAPKKTISIEKKD